MNWSKGFTVKERILIHLLAYAPYSEQDPVPEAVTQQGIAGMISAPRPHVSIALKDLRMKNHLTERTCRIERGKRKQKVYFLSSNGINLAKSLKAQVMELKIKVLVDSGEHFLKPIQATSNYKISLPELLNRVSPSGVLDLRTKKESEKPDQRSTHTSPPMATERIQEQSSYPEPPSQSIQLSQELKMQNEKSSYHYSYPYPYQHEYMGTHEEYAEGEQPMQMSEKGAVALFSIGYFLIILGFISGTYLIINAAVLFVIPMVIFFTFGISIMTISVTRLWSIEVWQSRIMNSLIMIIPIILYVLFFSAIQPGISYYDLGLWLIIIFSCFGLASFGTFIPESHRGSAVTALGIIIIINTTVTLLLNTLNIFYAGFWLLSGVLCIYLGYNLVLKQIVDLHSGITVGLALGILIACIYFAIIYEFENDLRVTLNFYIILIFWSIISIILLIQTYRNYTTSIIQKGKAIKSNPKVIEKMVWVLYASIPIFFGIILIFFGLVLLRFDKPMETIIELFLGALVVIYGARRLKDHEWPQISFAILLMIAIIFTLAQILFG